MEFSIPSLSDINVYDSLDERTAAENFLGKDLKQAEGLFRDSFIVYQEDLMWMGPKAFCYYLHAAIAYLVSGEANGDSTAVSSFCTVVIFRLDHDWDAIQPAHSTIREAIASILADFSRYECNVEICGDVASSYRGLVDRLSI